MLFFIFIIFLINRIHVQLDGNEYGVDQNGPKFPIEVFPSTTIRELRALVCKYCFTQRNTILPFL